jgi:hypothetical protein
MKNTIGSLFDVVRSIALTLSFILCCSTTSGGQRTQHRVAGDLVSRSETAIAIAKAVAEETYGSAAIAAQSPLAAMKEGTTWHVSGRLPAGTPGGVVEVWIAVRDGRVLRMTHGK